MHFVIRIALTAPVNCRKFINLAVNYILRNCVKTSERLDTIENKLILVNVY